MVELTTFVPVPEVTSSTVSPVTIVPVVVIPSVLVKALVNDEMVEYQLDVGVRVSVPLLAEKKGSSETALEADELRTLDLSLGGGVSDMSLPIRGPLETVTGEPSPMGTFDTRLKPKPNPGRELRACRNAALNPSSRSVIELVRLRELMRLGGMTRESAWGNSVAFKILLSSNARVFSEAIDGRLDSELDPERDTRSVNSALPRGAT